MLSTPQFPVKAKEIDAFTWHDKEFSVCTLVNNLQEYSQMQSSFIKAGFTKEVCEYLYIDNSKVNKYEAFAGLNRFLQEARGKYIILCHQDILLEHDTIETLRNRLAELEAKDPTWAVAGNAGGVTIRKFSMKIRESSGVFADTRVFPTRVKSLDENFLVVKRSANLALSGDLEGFHLYGTDLCTIAEVLGYKAYVIDFLLLHKSSGNVNSSFYKIRDAYIRKYQRLLQGTFIQTTITNFYISGHPTFNKLMNSKFTRFFVKHYFRPKGKPFFRKRR
jgi:hypothetical protein